MARVLNCVMTCEGNQNHVYAGNELVGYFIHSPPWRRLLYLEIDCWGGFTGEHCNYDISFQSIPIGRELVPHPAGPGHLSLEPFGYPHDPEGFQVLIWNVLDISLEFNRSLVQGIIDSINPDVVILMETRTRDLESFVPYDHSFHFGTNILHRSM
ncbi:uncharacterized protein G2W53_040128 [Senna tora]|uniref:Endonuclease/exonuclease/phosphatase domain-containing protein n=1 Tax=Senna tora TaxID=362788 RepID=A0A834W3C3_9FABA|nr:uncharacterized protein G2W53_040128 [Senna tora]